jgi:hypothetical protein
VEQAFTHDCGQGKMAQVGCLSHGFRCHNQSLKHGDSGQKQALIQLKSSSLPRFWTATVGVSCARASIKVPMNDSPPERIRNTLSHEMCHLACWLISNEPKEHHGAIFKSWSIQAFDNFSLACICLMTCVFVLGLGEL